MNNVVYLDKFLRPKVFHRGLLPSYENPNIAGKTKVKIVCSYIRKLFGAHGWTDFEETDNGYVIMFFPKLGFVDICKDTFIVED